MLSIDWFGVCQRGSAGLLMRPGALWKKLFFRHEILNLKDRSLFLLLLTFNMTQTKLISSDVVAERVSLKWIRIPQRGLFSLRGRGCCIFVHKLSLFSFIQQCVTIQIWDFLPLLTPEKKSLFTNTHSLSPLTTQQLFCVSNCVLVH